MAGRGYNGLVDLGYGHFRVDHSNDEFAKGAVHINGIEGFWGLAKVRLAKFKAYPDTPSTCTSRRPNGGTTIAMPTGTKPCYVTSDKTRSARQDPSLPGSVHSDGTRLAVVDNSNARVLIWNTIPSTTQVPADVVIGQPDFVTNNPACNDSSFFGVERAIIAGGKLIVANTSFDRVLDLEQYPHYQR